MTKYICKCGRVVQKSTNADNTGNRDTAGCEGCPYLLPWGPMVWDDQQKGYTQDVKGYECRMSPTLEYVSTYHGRADDKCSLHIVSLDLDFLDEVQAWIYDNAADTLSAGFSRGSMRGTDFCNRGRYSLSVTCAQNKAGMAAKAALIEHFFGLDKSRRGMTPQQEKAHILAAIEAGKARAQKKEDKTLTYKDPATGGLYRVGPKPFQGSYWVYYLDPASSVIWKRCPQGSLCAGNETAEGEEEYLRLNAKRNGWEPVEEPVFDYSGLDAQTVEVLHVAEHEILTARQTYICRVSAAVAAAHEAVVANCENGERGQFASHENTFLAWCASVGLKKDAAYRLLQVNALLTGATPEEQATLEAASPSLLYAAAKPSAPEELVQAVKDGDITTHKQYQEALAEIRAKDAKIQELMEVSRDAARQADEARAWAKKAEQEAALDRKEREDAHEKAMHYKAECDRRAQEQQRVEGLLSTREEQLREACKERDGAREALQAAKLRGDQWQEKAEARQARIQELESRPIQTTAMDSDEVDRLVAQRMEEELAKQTPRRQEEQEQAARDAYDAFILTARSLDNLWKALKPQISRLAPEQKTGAENLLLQKLMEVKEELIHACENCQS